MHQLSAKQNQPAKANPAQLASSKGVTPERDPSQTAVRLSGFDLGRIAVHGSSSRGIAAPPIVHDVLQSPGRPLDAATRAFMEPRFGHDFSAVRVHADAPASASAGAVDALAYTVGSHIAFRSGKYRPAAPAGRRLLAHELAHVLQQSRGSGAAADPEIRANSAAQRIMRGQSVTPAMVGSAPLGLYRQLDETTPADEENEDPWKKALRSSQRSVFGSAAQNPLLPANASPLFAPHNKLFFPDHFSPGQSTSTFGDKPQPPRSYALKDPRSESALSRRPIGQIGLRHDQSTAPSVKFGVGGMVNVDDQLNEQLEEARKKALARDDEDHPIESEKTGADTPKKTGGDMPEKTDADIEVNFLGDYDTKDGEEKSFIFDETKLSAGIEFKMALRRLKGLWKKPKARHDAYDDSSTQGDFIRQGASGKEDHRGRVKKQHEESPTGAGTENQKDDEGGNFELNANEQVGENVEEDHDTKSAITMPPLRPKMRTGLERQFDELARSTAPSVFAPHKKMFFPDRFSPGQSPSTIGGKSQPPKSYALKDPLSESALSQRPIGPISLPPDRLSKPSGNKWPIGIGFGGMVNVDDQLRKELKKTREKTLIGKDIVQAYKPMKTSPDLNLKLTGGYDNADKSATFDKTKVSAGVELDIALRMLERKQKAPHDGYDGDMKKQDEKSPGGIPKNGFLRLLKRLFRKRRHRQ